MIANRHHFEPLPFPKVQPLADPPLIYGRALLSPPLDHALAGFRCKWCGDEYMINVHPPLHRLQTGDLTFIGAGQDHPCEATALKRQAGAERLRECPAAGPAVDEHSLSLRCLDQDCIPAADVQDCEVEAAIRRPGPCAPDQPRRDRKRWESPPGGRGQWYRHGAESGPLLFGHEGPGCGSKEDGVVKSDRSETASAQRQSAARNLRQDAHGADGKSRERPGQQSQRPSQRQPESSAQCGQAPEDHQSRLERQDDGVGHQGDQREPAGGGRQDWQRCNLCRHGKQQEFGEGVRKALGRRLIYEMR